MKKSVYWILTIIVVFCLIEILLCLCNKSSEIKYLLSVQMEKICEVQDIGNATLFLDGSLMSGVCLEKIRQIEENRENEKDSIDLLIIRSNGGNSDEGVEIGRWVYENNINIQIRDYCFSACANYIFPAGKKKNIEEDAVVGWHGSEILENGRSKAIADISGVYTKEEISKKYSKYECSKKEEGCDENARKATKEVPKKVSDFYTNTLKEVNPEIMNYGLYEGMGFYNKFFKYDFYRVKDANWNLGEIKSWTFSIKDMEKFGIKNITYQGNDDYPNENSIYYRYFIQRGVLEYK